MLEEGDGVGTAEPGIGSRVLMARADGGTVIRTSMSPCALLGRTTVDAEAETVVGAVVGVEVGASFSRIRGRREQSGTIVRC
jgi:hypothetical protein